MPNHPRSAIFARVVLLPLALILSTVLGLGSHTETSDDVTLAWLFSGVLALKPVASLPLYFHGYGHALAAGYALFPNVSWLGLMLGTLLLGATVLCFAVLDRLLRPYLRPLPLALGLGLFFGLAWLEHWLWFSHVRVALLLAGAAMLFAAQRPERRSALLVGLAGLGAAWLIRPSLAALAYGAVLPAAVLLAGSWRRAAPVLVSAALGLALTTVTLAFRQTPAETQAQQRDRNLARILDFDQLRPQPRTPADSLGTAAISLWVLGDSTVVNEGLYRRAYSFNAADFFGREVPAKLRLRAGLLVRDYFPLLLALAFSAVVVARRQRATKWFWLVQLAYGGGLILLAGVFKLPPRMELPLLDFWLLTNLIFWLKPADYVNDTSAVGVGELGLKSTSYPLIIQRLGAGLALVVVLIYGVKAWHRGQVLGEEQQRHEAALAAISSRAAGRVCILTGTNDLLKSLSPFRPYRLGSGPVLLLTGWPSHDASQASLRRALSGTTDQTECLRRLAAPGSKPQALWVLTPETATWLNRRFRLSGPPLLLHPDATPLPAGHDLLLQVYQAQSGPEY